MVRPDRHTIFALSVLATALLAACGERGPTEYRLSGPTMGTSFSVAVVATTAFDREALQARIDGTLDDVDRHMSTYRPDSELVAFNDSESTDWIPVSRELCAAVEAALDFSRMSGGVFDITVGPLVNLWGFGPDGSRTEPPDDATIEETRLTTGWRKLHTDCARPAMRKDTGTVRVDLSGFAKGLAADELAALLDESGLDNYLVEIGGELRVRGLNADAMHWRIAIERPDELGRSIAQIIQVSDVAVATSGDYRNYFEYAGRRYSHTIDPRTGRPVTHNLASVSVIAERAADADALATALMVLGPEAGPAFAEANRISAYFLLRNGNEFSEMTSSRFPAVQDQ